MLSMTSPLAFALGGASIGLAAVGTLAATGTLPAAWDALATYSGTYLGSSPSGDPAVHIPLVLAPLLVVCAGREWTRFNRLERGAVLWLLLGLVAIVLQGRQLGHYATPLIIPAALLSAHAARRAIVRGYVAFAVALVLATFVFTLPQRGPATVAVADWVTEHTRKDDRILVWGVDANVYLASERAVAGRYPYLMPLVTRGYTTPEQVAAWVADLDVAPPTVIVDSEAANPHWPDGDDFLRPPPPGAAGGRDLDILDPFRRWVEEHYVLSGEIHGRKLYLRRVSLIDS